MKDIQQMFFDLALLVDEQGEMLDCVQVNVECRKTLYSLDCHYFGADNSNGDGLTSNNYAQETDAQAQVLHSDDVDDPSLCCRGFCFLVR